MKVEIIKDADDFNDYLLNGDDIEGDTIEYKGKQYKVEGVTDFIDDYSFDNYSQQIYQASKKDDFSTFVEGGAVGILIPLN